MRCDRHYGNACDHRPPYALIELPVEARLSDLAVRGRTTLEHRRGTYDRIIARPLQFLGVASTAADAAAPAPDR